MIKENERITYEEFMTMFKFAPRMCYTLYEKAEDEINKLKKQKDDVVEYIKYNATSNYFDKDKNMFRREIDLLRMLGEIDE